MTHKPLLLALVLTLAAFSRLSAEDPGTPSIVIEPPAPASYTEDRPAYAFFKKIEVSPRSSGSYDVTITLQADIPTTFPKDRGLYVSMTIDFAEISPEKSLNTNHIPHFNEDLVVSLNRNVGSPKFDPYAGTVEYHGRKWDFKVSSLIVRKDTITFTLRSPLFALHPPSKVVFRTNPMKAQSPTQSSGIIGHETTPVVLDPGAATAPK